MRIAFISDLWQPLFPGGAERYMKNLAEALAQRGHDIYVITSYNKAKPSFPHTIQSFPVGEARLLGLEQIQRIAWAYKPDLLVTHHYFAGEFPELFSMGIPCLEVVHSRQRNPKAAMAVFNSRYTADRCDFREGDMVILPPAGNDIWACGHPQIEKIGDISSCDVCRMEWNHKETPVLKCCIGHIKPIPNRLWKGQWYGKGIELTYRLARIMPERKFLVLRGEWQDVEYIKRWPNVEFMEPIDDIREFYARCRLVVMPSGSEDAGTVPQECAINGIPCISSNVGGLIETNIGGITLPVHDFESWLKEIAKLDNREYYDEIVRRQRLAIATMNWPARFDELDAKLRAICAK
jgi:glycosyltransferase involved in cell wall biosynthesis